jgi:hypothetical protein
MESEITFVPLMQDLNRPGFAGGSNS